MKRKRLSLCLTISVYGESIVIMNILGFSDQAWATIVAAIFLIPIGVNQLRWSLKQNKKTDAFNELSKRISEAKKLITNIQTNSNQLINSLAKKGDAILRGENSDDKMLAESQEKNINSIYDSQFKIIEIIEMIDKSTVINEKTKNAAKQLYYLALYQHSLVEKCNQIIQVMAVDMSATPKPLISPELFIKISEIYGIVIQGSIDIQSYLDDLEVIIHNDLVKSVFKKAEHTKLERKILTISGITDIRTKRPLR